MRLAICRSAIFWGLMAVVCPTADALQTSYSDGEFNPAEWIAIKVIDTTAGQTGTCTVYQAGSAGNPGACRTMEHAHSQNQLGFAHLCAWAVYDPAVRGPITTISFSYDVRAYQLGSAGGILFRPLLVQSGNVFTVNLTNTIFQTNTWELRVHTGLTWSSFCKIGNCFVKPDFSETAPPIQFGFFTFTSTTAPSNFSQFAIDNWSVSILSTAPVKFVTATLEETGVALRWLTDTGVQYQLQRAISPFDVWTNQGPPIYGNGGDLAVTNSIDAPSAWYRLLKLSP
ncbi:MAG: hypothetical protein NZ740_04005 [Kiritimatiellae bacterium]|nr:hypothetical protein [Kiritimatiellia bacterium]MDW8458253.1 hypothetical protein [Verrucomicrobiota bacterium]